MNREEILDNIRLLEEIRDCELKKPVEEMDCDLIDYCVQEIAQFCGKSAQLPSSFEEGVKLSDIRKNPEKKEQLENVTAINKPTEKKRKNFKKLILVAACIGLLSALLGVYSLSNESFFSDYVMEKYGCEENIPYYERFINGNHEEGQTRIDAIYKNTEEAEKGLNKDLLKLTYLPEDLTVQEINYGKDIDGIYKLGFLIVEQEENIETFLSFSGEKRKLNESDTKYATETREVNGFTCYIKEYEESPAQCYFVYKDFVYMVGYYDIDEIVKIIENIER